ncbi:alpha-ketoglutarate-dependent dioxygenase AlkB [Pseudomonas qingdaonensis]|nr:alpha-ketoglutarate-dependent dioxygenase AlkB [Pseudomonas qingdaonensis]
MKQPELDLFGPPALGAPEWIGKQTLLLPGFALDLVEPLLPALRTVLRAAPFRNQLTPAGAPSKWRSPIAGRWAGSVTAWATATALRPAHRQALACPAHAARRAGAAAAEAAGFAHFRPDACLINHYQPGNRLTLHQDRNERDFSQPIVSISLGLPAVFLFGGHTRSEPTRKVGLQHGDVMVWGGEDRLRFHGVNPLKDGEHPLLGARRINLTLRKAGQPD